MAHLNRLFWPLGLSSFSAGKAGGEGAARAPGFLPRGAKGGKCPLGSPARPLGSGGREAHVGARSARLSGQVGGWVPVPAFRAHRFALGHLPPLHLPPQGPRAACAAVCFPGWGSVGALPWVPTATEPPASPTPQDPLSGLERELALQLQIAEAARRLCREGNLSRQARRQRKHAMLQEEKKLRELERCLGEQRRTSGPPPAAALPLGRGEPVALRVPSRATRASCELGWHGPGATAFAFVPGTVFHSPDWL